MRPVTITKSLAVASANNIAHVQSLAGAGNFTLNGSTVSGGVATLDTARRVLITDGGDNHTVTYTVYGTNSFGNPIQQNLTGTNTGTVASTLDFLTITRVHANGAVQANTTIGTNGVGSTQWVSVSPHIATAELMVSNVITTGSVNYTVEYTYQDVNYSPTSFYAYNLDNVVPAVWPDAVVTGAATNAVATMNDPVWAARVTINSGTGTLQSTFLQAGIAGAGR